MQTKSPLSQPCMRRLESGGWLQVSNSHRVPWCGTAGLCFSCLHSQRAHPSPAPACPYPTAHGALCQAESAPRADEPKDRHIWALLGTVRFLTQAVALGVEKQNLSVQSSPWHREGARPDSSLMIEIDEGRIGCWMQCQATKMIRDKIQGMVL